METVGGPKEMMIVKMDSKNGFSLQLFHGAIEKDAKKDALMTKTVLTVINVILV